MKPNTLDITNFFDEESIPTVAIPLSNAERDAILYKEDFDLLINMGVNPVWRLSANCVLAKGKQPIARLIMDAKAKETVRYKDGNPCNLKRDNLVTVIGGGRSNARERLLEKPLTFRAKVHINHIHKLPSWEVAESLSK